MGVDVLPWSVVYGGWVWSIALIGMIGTALVYTWGQPRRRARRRWRAARDRFGDRANPEAGLEGKRITVAGRLEADGSRERYEDGADVALTSVDGYRGEPVVAAASLSVDTGDHVLGLEGPLALAAGTREYRPGGNEPADLTGLIRQRIAVDEEVRLHAREALVFASLEAGDRVLARGELALAASGEGADYRGAAHRFVLRDVELIGESPPAVSGPRVFRAIPRLVTALAAFLLVFGGGGECAYQRAKSVDISADNLDLDAAFAAQLPGRLAAMTPFRRQKALAEIRRAVRHARASVPTREALVGLAELRGRCIDAVDELIAHRQYHRALERIGSCPAPHLEGIARYALGDLEAASRALADATYEHAVRVHLLAGELERARQSAGRMAELYREPDARSDPEVRAVRERVAVAYDCIADAIAARAGDREARARLEKATSSGSIECRLLFADLAGGPRADELLSPWPEDDFLGSYRIAETANWLYIERDPVGRAAHAFRDDTYLRGVSSDHVMSFNDEGAFHGGVPRSVLAKLEAAGELDAEAAQLRDLLRMTGAIEEAFLSRFERARELVGAVGPAVIDGVEPRAVAAFVELRAGDLDAARARLGDTPPPHFFGGRVARIVSSLVAREVSPDVHLSLLSRRAINAGLGDEPLQFEGLDVELREHHFHSSLLSRIAIFAPWLPPYILADHLEYARHIGYTEMTFSTASAIGFLANQAHVARVALSPVAAERISAVGRIRDAAGRRDIAVPLAVLDAL